MIARRSPPLTDLGPEATTLAVIAAAHCWMPHPDVVAACAGAVFPTIRASSTAPRMTIAAVAGMTT